jgi:hypothetical protein
MQKIISTLSLPSLFFNPHTTKVTRESTLLAAGPTYIKFETFQNGATSCAGVSQSGASMTGTCQSVNSTMSSNIMCDGSVTCTSNQFNNEHCTGKPAQSLTINTNGKCESLKDPSGQQGIMYGKFTQAVGAAAAVEGMKKPYIGMWDAETCTGGAMVYSSSAACLAAQDMSFTMQCFTQPPGTSGPTEVIKSCNYQNSTSCGGTDITCYPMPADSLSCKSIPGTSVAKALTYYC